MMVFLAGRGDIVYIYGFFFRFFFDFFELGNIKWLNLYQILQGMISQEI